MAEYKLQALRTFEGNEGIVRRGDVFKVESKDRADQLQRLELAAEADKDASITHYAQMKAELAKLKKDELQEVAAAENVDIKEGATKEEINTKILQKRETDYLTGQAQAKNAGTEGLAGTIAGSGASGGIAAGGTTGGSTATGGTAAGVAAGGTTSGTGASSSASGGSAAGGTTSGGTA